VGSEDRGVGIFLAVAPKHEDIQRLELVPLLFLCERTGQDVFQVNHDKGIGPVGEFVQEVVFGGAWSGVRTENARARVMAESIEASS